MCHAAAAFFVIWLLRSRRAKQRMHMALLEATQRQAANDNGTSDWEINMSDIQYVWH